ncbi:MAG: hypothetical protein QF785_07600, partial [Phycisphaeraceae bacterium]|nr:hypothetical protein [Phycisphaeraceae bacterium]
EQGRIPRDEPVCVCITGNGLKTVEAMQGQFHELPVINAKIGEFDEVVKEVEETLKPRPVVAG